MTAACPTLFSRRPVRCVATIAAMRSADPLPLCTSVRKNIPPEASNNSILPAGVATPFHEWTGNQLDATTGHHEAIPAAK